MDQQTEKSEPSLVIIVNNYAAFNELFEEKLDDIIRLSRDGSKYGIYFILTCTGVNNIRHGLLENFKYLYCLQLNNIDDYSIVVGETGGFLPSKLKGRGLLRQDRNRLLEFQVAYVTKDESSNSFIRKFAKKIAEKYSAFEALAVPVLPKIVSVQFLSNYINKDNIRRIPIGVEKETLEIFYYNFTANPVNLVLSVNQEWQSFTDAIGSLVANVCGIKTMILTLTGKTLTQPNIDKLQIFNDINCCVNAVYDIYNIVLARNNEYKNKLAAGDTLPQFEPVLVIIQSMSLLIKMLERYKSSENVKKEADDDTPLNRLNLSLAKCDSVYNIYFIIADNLHSNTLFRFEEWYKTHINGTNGIWIGNGINTQYLLTINKKPQNFRDDLDYDYGVIVNNAVATIVKLLQTF